MSPKFPNAFVDYPLSLADLANPFESLISPDPEE